MDRYKNVDHQQVTDRKKKLGRQILQRRAELDLTQEVVSQLGGISSETLRQYEVGRIPDRPTSRILESIDTALGWCVGSSKAVLMSGAEPIVDGEPQPLQPTTMQVLPQADSPVTVNRSQLRQLVNLSTGLLANAANANDPKELLDDLTALNRLANEMTLTAV